MSAVVAENSRKNKLEVGGDGMSNLNNCNETTMVSLLFKDDILNLEKVEFDVVDVEITPKIKTIILERKAQLLEKGIIGNHIVGLDYRLILETQSTTIPKSTKTKSIDDIIKELGWTKEEVHNNFIKECNVSSALRQYLNRKIIRIFDCDIYLVDAINFAIGD